MRTLIVRELPRPELCQGVVLVLDRGQIIALLHGKAGPFLSLLCKSVRGKMQIPKIEFRDPFRHFTGLPELVVDQLCNIITDFVFPAIEVENVGRPADELERSEHQVQIPVQNALFQGIVRGVVDGKDGSRVVSLQFDVVELASVRGKAASALLCTVNLGIAKLFSQEKAFPWNRPPCARPLSLPQNDHLRAK